MKKLMLTLIMGIGSIALSIGQGQPATVNTQVESEKSVQISKANDQVELTAEQLEVRKVKAQQQRKRPGAVAIEDSKEKTSVHVKENEQATPMSQQELKALIEKELEEEDKKQGDMGSKK